MTDKVGELLTRLDSATSAAEVRALTAELKRALADRGSRPRLRRRRTKTSPDVLADPESGAQGTGPDDVDQAMTVHEQQLAGIWTADAEPRRRSAHSQVIDGRPVDDPGGYGQRNDLRRWSPWR